MQVTSHDLVALWPTAVAAVLVTVAIYTLVQTVMLRLRGPRDTVGNGIMIGNAKAFDNRTLTLRIERLSTGLAALKVVNQNVTDSLTSLQGEQSNQATRTLSLSLRPVPSTGATEAAKPKVQPAQADAKVQQSEEPRSAVGAAATDVLSDQLALASQIVNLETLYERSLTDRLFDETARLQTVLGFQVSITPPAGFEDAVAVAEVAVRVKEAAPDSAPVSLVAQIPQEKTYNSQSVSRTSTSIEGSAVAQVVSLGIGSKGEARDLYIHRDSDTVAFERDPRGEPQLFEDGSATTFGWEFRPVLARRTVSPGTRQMLAVIALPKPETDQAGAVAIEIKRRTYWRAYNRKRQTSRGKWGPLPWRIDQSHVNDFEIETIEIPNSAMVQKALAPKITDIKWVSCGGDRAMVIVTGLNFFSGTKIGIGGDVLGEDDRTLTLKSDRALEFTTPVASLTSASAVLIGRFGPSVPLITPKTSEVPGFSIESAQVKASAFSDSLRISVDVRGETSDLTIAELRKLPEPLLFVGVEVVPGPYDYSKVSLQGVDGKCITVVRVEAWVPAKLISKSPSVSFRIPFCGEEYDSSLPFSLAEPSIIRMGDNDRETLFRIRFPFMPAGAVSVDLDKTYIVDGKNLAEITSAEYAFAVETKIAERFENIVVRVSDRTSGRSLDPYVLPIPRAGKQEVVSIDLGAKPPEVAKGSRGPVQWSGIGLNAVVSATLMRSGASNGTVTPKKSSAGTAAEIIAFAGGSRIEVYFPKDSTKTAGAAEVQFQTAAGQMLRAPLFIL